MKKLLYLLPLVLFSCGKSSAEIELKNLRDSIKFAGGGTIGPTEAEEKMMGERAQQVADSINKAITASMNQTLSNQVK